MWTSREVQKWMDENIGLTSAQSVDVSASKCQLSRSLWIATTVVPIAIVVFVMISAVITAFLISKREQVSVLASTEWDTCINGFAYNADKEGALRPVMVPSERPVGEVLVLMIPGRCHG